MSLHQQVCCSHSCVILSALAEALVTHRGTRLHGNRSSCLSVPCVSVSRPCSLTRKVGSMMINVMTGLILGRHAAACSCRRMCCRQLQQDLLMGRCAQSRLEDLKVTLLRQVPHIYIPSVCTASYQSLHDVLVMRHLVSRSSC